MLKKQLLSNTFIFHLVLQAMKKVLFLLIVTALVSISTYQVHAQTDVNKIYFPIAQEKTYTTFPEWFIVFSAQEYGQFLQKNPPSAFPYVGSIFQYWNSYYQVYEITSTRNYPFTWEDHTMLMVIGISYSAEYAVKELYENTIGVVSELTSFGSLTQEDIYAQKIAQDYGNFLVHTPWYEFPFDETLTGLWNKTGILGKAPIRKWERKLALTLEYGTKALYAWGIKAATESTFAPANPEITMTVYTPHKEILTTDSRIRVINTSDKNINIVGIPRYKIFNEIVPVLARSKVSFLEIAGNKNIMITVIAPRTYQFNLSFGKELFSQPILTSPVKKRIAIDVPVIHLTETINALEGENVLIEHIYDY